MSIPGDRPEPNVARSLAVFGRGRSHLRVVKKGVRSVRDVTRLGGVRTETWCFNGVFRFVTSWVWVKLEARK